MAADVKPNTVSLPSIDTLAKAYRAAVASSDLRLAGVMEAAVFQIAIAEAAIAEAGTLAQFATRVQAQK